MFGTFSVRLRLFVTYFCRSLFDLSHAHPDNKCTDSNNLTQRKRQGFIFDKTHTDTVKTMRMEGSNKSRYGHQLPSDIIIQYSHIHKRKHSFALITWIVVCSNETVKSLHIVFRLVRWRRESRPLFLYLLQAICLLSLTQCFRSAYVDRAWRTSTATSTIQRINIMNFFVRSPREMLVSPLFVIIERPSTMDVYPTAADAVIHHEPDTKTPECSLPRNIVFTSI